MVLFFVLSLPPPMILPTIRMIMKVTTPIARTLASGEEKRLEIVDF